MEEIIKDKDQRGKVFLIIIIRRKMKRYQNQDTFETGQVRHWGGEGKWEYKQETSIGQGTIMIES